MDRANVRLWVPCLSALLFTGCFATEETAAEVAVRSEALEFGCLFALADASAELGPRAPNGRDIVTTEPYVTSTAQNYGSLGCSGFVGDFYNPNGHNINRILVAGGGWVNTLADFNVFGTEELCANLTLEADIYGFRNGATETLDSIAIRGELRPKDDGEGLIDRCHLSHMIVQPGVFESIRVVGRVSNSTATYPFRMHAG